MCTIFSKLYQKRPAAAVEIKADEFDIRADRRKAEAVKTNVKQDKTIIEEELETCAQISRREKVIKGKIYLYLLNMPF